MAADAARIYPNPAKDQITIYSEDGFDNTVVIELYNVQGQRVDFQIASITQNRIQLNLLVLGSGVYFLELRDAKHTKRQPFIIKK